MDFVQYKAGADDDGRRLDRIVRRFLSHQTISALYSALRKGFIRVNGRRAATNERVRKGDVISVAQFLIPQQQKKSIKARESFPYEIIFHNEHFLIINKPYDVAVHGKNSIAEAVAAYYNAHRENSSLSFLPGPLHRLDKKTTGVLFFSWSITGARFFSRALKEHALEKQYVALVHGIMPAPCIWKDFIKKTEATAAFHTVRVSSTAKLGSRLAQTRAHAIASGMYEDAPVSLVNFTIATGRTHQIRAQSAFHGFPLLGDTAYGSPALYNNQKLFLHAQKIIIGENPVGLPHEIEAPLPNEFMQMNKKILLNGRK